MNMETMRYIKRKKESAWLLLRAANAARESVVNMLKDDWLLDIDIIGEDMGNDTAIMKEWNIISAIEAFTSYRFLGILRILNTAQRINEWINE